jgi:hypothetical protein
MLALLSFCTFFARTKVTLNIIYATLADFGFTGDSSFAITVADLRAGSTYGVGLLDQTAAHAAHNLLSRSPGDPDPESCSNLSSVVQLFKATESDFTYNGTVARQSILTPVILDCNATHATLQVTERYINDGTLLDYRHLKTLKLKSLTIALVGLILALWLANWFRHRRVSVPVHHFHTAILFAALLTPILRLHELNVLSVSDDESALGATRTVIEIVQDSLLFSTMLLTAKGWCIVRDSLTRLEIVRSIGLSIAFVTFGFLVTAHPEGVSGYVYLVFAFTSFFVFIIELIASINRAWLHILAHLLVIANAGIAPETTPVYAKHRLYERFEYAVVLFSVLYSLRMACSLIVEMDFWIDELAADLIKVGIYATLAWLLRLRGSESGEYTPVASSGLEVPLADIETLSLQSEDLQRGGIKWEQGMSLPGAPVIVESASLVTLASPDGTARDLVFTEERIEP